MVVAPALIAVSTLSLIHISPRGAERHAGRARPGKETVVVSAAVTQAIPQPVTGERRGYHKVNLRGSNLLRRFVRLQNAVCPGVQFIQRPDTACGHFAARTAQRHTDGFARRQRVPQDRMGINFLRRGNITENTRRPLIQPVSQHLSGDLPVNIPLCFRVLRRASFKHPAAQVLLIF